VLALPTINLSKRRGCGHHDGAVVLYKWIIKKKGSKLVQSIYICKFLRLDLIFIHSQVKDGP
jgi:hypothetical protein